MGGGGKKIQKKKKPGTERLASQIGQRKGKRKGGEKGRLAAVPPAPSSSKKKRKEKGGPVIRSAASPVLSRQGGGKLKPDHFCGEREGKGARPRYNRFALTPLSGQEGEERGRKEEEVNPSLPSPKKRGEPVAMIDFSLRGRKKGRGRGAQSRRPGSNLQERKKKENKSNCPFFHC